MSGDVFDGAAITGTYNGGSGDNVGYSLFSGFSTAENDDTNYEEERLMLGLGLFTRDFLLGKLGLDYKTYDSEYDFGAGADSTTEKEGTGYGEMYFDNANLIFRRTVIDSNIIGEIDTAEIQFDY